MPCFQRHLIFCCCNCTDLREEADMVLWLFLVAGYCRGYFCFYEVRLFPYCLITVYRLIRGEKLERTQANLLWCKHTRCLSAFLKQNLISGSFDSSSNISLSSDSWRGIDCCTIRIEMIICAKGISILNDQMTSSVLYFFYLLATDPNIPDSVSPENVVLSVFLRPSLYFFSLGFGLSSHFLFRETSVSCFQSRVSFKEVLSQ